LSTGNTTFVLGGLLDQIRHAHAEKRSDDLPPLVREFITVAANRLDVLAQSSIRKYAPDMAGETDALFNEAYQRLVATLQKRLPPANPVDYFHIAAVQIRYALWDLLRERMKSRRHLPVPSDVAGDSTALPERLGNAELMERFFQAIEELPEPLRTYYDLHKTQGLTHLQCAERVGLTLKQAKTRWEAVQLTLGRRLGSFSRDL